MSYNAAITRFLLKRFPLFKVCFGMTQLRSGTGTFIYPGKGGDQSKFTHSSDKAIVGRLPRPRVGLAKPTFRGVHFRLEIKIILS